MTAHLVASFWRDLLVAVDSWQETYSKILCLVGHRPFIIIIFNRSCVVVVLDTSIYLGIGRVPPPRSIVFLATRMHLGTDTVLDVAFRPLPLVIILC